MFYSFIMENQALLWQQRRKEKALLIQVKAIKRKLAREDQALKDVKK